MATIQTSRGVRLTAVLGGLLLLSLGCSADRTGNDGDDDGTQKPPEEMLPPVNPETPNTQCKKVDILFVIDDSGSMADNQKSLIASFPGFINGMRNRLKTAQDFHVGVVTSDAYYRNEAGCTAIGSLITKTGGPQSSNKVCGPFEGGGRYLQASDSMLQDRFACAAQVGTGGSDDERMARGLLDAIAPAKGKCNDGFLRPDSLLVIVMITDEDDVPDGCDGSGTCLSYGSGGDPDKWYDEFIRSRKPDNVVMLSLLGRRLDNPCGAVPASRLMRLTNKFGKNGFLGDVCAPTYDKFFEDALPLLDQACSIFTPSPA